MRRDRRQSQDTPGELVQAFERLRAMHGGERLRVAERAHVLDELGGDRGQDRRIGGQGRG